MGGPVGSVGGVWSWCAAVGTTSRNASFFLWELGGGRLRENPSTMALCLQKLPQ